MMKATLKDTNIAHEILKSYNGTNPYMIYLKNGVFAYKNKTLTDFDIDYIIKTNTKEPILINKVVKVTKWYGEKKQLDWETDFIIEKLLISYFFGENSDYYHCMVKYRQSVDFQPLFIPKNAVLTNLFAEDFLKKEIDFSKYNNDKFKLTEAQEKSIKFLTTRKKGILSLEMGMGKSMASIVAALEAKYNKILIICPASLKTNWKNEISRFESEDDITIVEGSKWKENKWTIINYDILKNFYTVAKETKTVRVKEYTDSGFEWVTKEKTTKTNKKEIVDECLENSQLFNMNFDLVIIDEAHRLSNKTSGIYEIVDDLIRRTKIDSIYALTGTIIKNDPINLYNILKIIGCEFCQTYQNYTDYLKNYCGAKQIFKNKKERDYYSNKFIASCGKLEWKFLSYDEKRQLDEYLTKNCKKIWIMGEPSNLEELAERIKPYYYREVNDMSKVNFTSKKSVIDYELTSEEKKIYDSAWNEYISSHEETDIDALIENHRLIEGSVFRQALADFMISRTIKLAENELNNGKKIIIFCCFDKELYSLQEYFGEKCVIYNGKMTAKQKDKSLKKFKEDDSVTVFIGNIQAASVGLNINEASTVIFQNCSFVPSDNVQAEFRCQRLGQTKDVNIFYQKFSNTYMDRLFEILEIKNSISNTLIG